MKQQQALDIIKAGYNVFLTGPAGSGKTHVLNQCIKLFREHGLTVGVTASTGIAATHLQGSTIHSWSGIGVRDYLSDWDVDSLVQKEHLHKRYTKTDLLIIDEISMLHARQLDMVNQLAQAFRDDPRPFGGMQVVLCGDFFQLPPISRDGAARYVIESQTWNELDLKMCYLDEQHRQHDTVLLRILHEIRSNTVSEQSKQALQQRMKASFSHTLEPTKLFTHNTDVDRINTEELNKLTTETKTYFAHTKGKKGLVATLLKSTPVAEKLELRIGAQVLFIKNDQAQRYVNGTRGVVVSFESDGLPVVELVNGRHITAEPAEWSIEENDVALASITQIPLKLAWAITVHKSQGMSLDVAEVDLSQAFEPGMGYVALSRVRTLDGLVLRGINTTALTINHKVLAFDQIIQHQSNAVIKNSTKLLKNPVQEFEKRTQVTSDDEKIKNHHKTKLLLEQELSLNAIANELGFTVSTIINHIERLVQEGETINFDELLPDAENNEEVREAFEELGTQALKPVFEFFDGKYPYTYLQLMRVWIISEN